MIGNTALKVKKMALALKPVVQKFDYDCGGAAVVDLLSLLGREDVINADLYQRLDVNPMDGTKSQNIKKLFEEEKIEYSEKFKATVDDLDKLIKEGCVCLISYQAWGTEEEMDNLDSGHYSIVFEVDKEYVWLIDPTIDGVEVPGSVPGIVRRSKDYMERRWVDKGTAGEIYDHWLLAVKVAG